MFVDVAIFLLISCIGRQGAEVAGKILPPLAMTNRVSLDPEENYILLWTPRENDIVFEVQVKTKGYVGLGFSPNGGMMGADIVIGWVDDQGEVQLSDRYGATPYDTPVVDSSQDYVAISGSVNDTHTTLRFSRPWSTCDEDNDYVLSGDTVKVIWSYHSTRPDDPMQATISHHEKRGTKSMFLKEIRTDFPKEDFEGTIWDITVNELELPSNVDTMYWCKIVKVPDWPKKHQIIAFEPLIEETNIPYLHHLVIFECVMENSSYHLEKYVNGKGDQCYSKNMPPVWHACSAPVIAWAVGSDGEIMPEDVGYSLREEYGGATYYMLQIHYDNPTFKEGIVDSSGMRAFVTDQLRPYEADTLSVGNGVNPLMIIPPRMAHWQAKKYCASECTKEYFPEDGVKVFSVLLHSHLLGRKIIVQHLRNGIELEPLAVDNNYDFNYQQSRTFRPPKILLPGDELIVTCDYDSSEKNETTFAGFGTNEEMCIAYFGIYPKVRLDFCGSSPHLESLGKVFGIEKFDENSLAVLYSNTDLSGKVKEKEEKAKGNLSEEDQSKEDEEEDKGEENKVEEDISDSESLKVKNIKKSDALRLITVSEPESMKGTSLYDIFDKDSTWEDKNILEKAHDTWDSHNYIVCYSSTAKQHQAPKYMEAQPFVPYIKEGPSCPGK